jgi:hypothetical protein
MFRKSGKVNMMDKGRINIISFISYVELEQGLVPTIGIEKYQGNIVMALLIRINYLYKTMNHQHSQNNAEPLLELIRKLGTIYHIHLKDRGDNADPIPK